ncbi:HNH endonuclease [Microbacterium sp. NPDC091662]|uniref:HNH endonuclease n=1 Tax=Microbacterium sp. NPDC091662 TaxID=3364211 RepID=UPI0037F614CC
MVNLSSPAYLDMRSDLRDMWAAAQAPCWLCGQAIDYSLPFGDKSAFELDHVKPRKTHPWLTLDRNNCRPSHSRCNRSKGAGAAGPGLGEASEDW